MNENLKKLAAHIADNCKTIDRESRFDDMLDECYSFEGVGGPFACMSPSRVLKECDPVAYRCGVNDFADGEEWTEIGGEYYDRREAEESRDEYVAELESEADALEEQIDEEGDDASEADKTKLAELRADAAEAARVELSTL